MDTFMRESDAFSWYMERDPILRSTVVAIVWLDRSPDWEAFAARAEWATGQVPSFRQRVVEPPGRLAPPRWTEDEAFDLSWHVRRMEAPAAHDARAVVDFARGEAPTTAGSLPTGSGGWPRPRYRRRCTQPGTRGPLPAAP